MRKWFKRIIFQCLHCTQWLYLLILQIPLKSVTSIVDGLKKSYIEKLRPLEKTYQFQDFVSPLLVIITPFLLAPVLFDNKATSSVKYWAVFFIFYEKTNNLRPNLRRSQFEHTNSWIIANKQKTSRKWYLSDITQKPSWRVWCQRGDPLCTQCFSNFSLKPFPYHSFIAHFYSFSKSIAWQKIISDGLQNLFFSGFQIMFF